MSPPHSSVQSETCRRKGKGRPSISVGESNYRQRNGLLTPKIPNPNAKQYHAQKDPAVEEQLQPLGRNEQLPEPACHDEDTKQRRHQKEQPNSPPIPKDSNEAAAAGVDGISEARKYLGRGK